MIKTKKIAFITLSVILGVALLSGGFFIGKNYKAGQNDDLKAVKLPYVETVEDADVFIDMPNLRQYGGYTCGTTCTQMIVNWVFPYEGDINLANLEKELGTTDEGGTKPTNIINYLSNKGIKVSPMKKMSTDSLATFLKNGFPVLMSLQAWSSADDGSYNTSEPQNTDTYLIEGHYVICVGYKATENGRIFYFNDPACVGYCYMTEAELNSRWIDMDAEALIYDHYGIVIESKTEYNPYGVFHLE